VELSGAVFLPVWEFGEAPNALQSDDDSSDADELELCVHSDPDDDALKKQKQMNSI
jgi:hypothetical protein